MRLSLCLLASLLLAGNAHARTLSFEDVWSAYYGKSHEMQSIQYEKKAHELSLDRGKLHWLPKASLMGQWSRTNDPGQVFINNLGQRSITQADFNPATLNYPGFKNFLNGTLRVDLPLYEGGMKANNVSMLELVVEASKKEGEAKQTEQFTLLSKHFGSLLTHVQNASLLRSLQKDLQGIISSYQVGAKSNPVGYSGLLGLKGVMNRVTALLAYYDVQVLNDKQWISEKIDEKNEWSPQTDSTLMNFLDNHLDVRPGESSQLLAHALQASSLSYASKMEKSRFLPRIGLFAQNQFYSGNRDDEHAQAFGAYVMWELFNHDSYNRVSEANAKTMAAEAKIRAARQDQKIMRDNLIKSKSALEETLSLLEKNNDLLHEQTLTSRRLFRAGLLNALQLSEVYNRRVDAIEAKTKAEVQYIEVRTGLHQLSH